MGFVSGGHGAAGETSGPDQPVTDTLDQALRGPYALGRAEAGTVLCRGHVHAG
jgi:hypothetical protein